MDFDRLYGFSDADEPGTFRVELGRAFDATNIVGGTEEPPELLCFGPCVGRKVKDVIATGDPALLLLSRTILDCLKSGGFGGWRSFPVDVTGRLGKRITGYEGLVITGRSGPIDWSKGVYRRMPPRIASSNPYDAWIGMYFDPASWDGSDLFMPEGTTYPIVVERVKAAFERAEITNVRFKPLTEFERTWPA